jgi:hypothetical protein
LQPIRAELEAKGFKLYIVSHGTQEDLAFLQPTGLAVLVDPEGKAWAAYGITGIPCTFFVNGAGVIHKVSLGWGEGSLSEFRETVKQLTGGP